MSGSTFSDSIKDRPPDRVTGADQRYGEVSRILHWTIAGLIVLQICIGWYMNEILPDHSPQRAAVLPWHISIGLTILILVVIRIAVRLTHLSPPLPAGIATWERVLARMTHVLFYVLLLVLPLTGWALVSLGNRPIAFWGAPWPKLPGLGALFGSPAPHAVRHTLGAFHTDYLIWIILANLALHVAGALKHQFDGNPVLWRMTWLKRPKR